eukprot:GFUD01012574.1.p1 GENE.GFUD01012574.1~~GFUD01012574.1.p1  ORF type:complete len:171 (-),score=62.15 GFUD01012574.1:56-568(-)
MAFARLFGKNKKDPASPTWSSASADHTEREGEEGFTVLESRQTNPVVYSDHPPVYPSLSAANLPYLLPGGPPGVVGVQGGGAGGGVGVAKAREQQSNINPLDGVHFALSHRLTTDTELQYMATAVDSVMARLKSIEWASLEYNFTLERSVLDSQVMSSGEDMEGLTLSSN